MIGERFDLIRKGGDRFGKNEASFSLLAIPFLED
jgi:hypothetical protein